MHEHILRTAFFCLLLYYAATSFIIVISRLDYCNVVLALQQVVNAAVHLGLRDHVTEQMKEIHW